MLVAELCFQTQFKLAYRGVFKNQGPYCRPQNNRAFMIRTPTKFERTPNLQKQPQGPGNDCYTNAGPEVDGS